MKKSFSSFRSLLAAAVLDAPRYAYWVARGNWKAVRNRGEKIDWSPDRTGVVCRWSWTTSLRAPAIFRRLGAAVAACSFKAHPIGFYEHCNNQKDSFPRVSFLIGHRGVSRIPHLLATLKSIAAQRAISFECIVIEQDVESHLRNVLPEWVRLIRNPPPEPDLPYCRSWAFNVGARQARGQILVLHDNDMPIPEDYAIWVSEKVGQGFEVVNPKRFIFYLNKAASSRVVGGYFDESEFLEVDEIVQNLEAGGSVAITKEAYEAIGGMDERFVGWGGEDNEFWERALTRRAWVWGGLPILHLWHQPQPGKLNRTNPAVLLYERLRTISPVVRIGCLPWQEMGRLSAPWSDEAK